MIPVVTPAEMAEIDAAASDPVQVLIGRAGAATAAAALGLLGGGYGRRVVVLAGKGHNGDDGRDAAQRLRRRGVRCTVLGPEALPRRLDGVDLVIDALLGTGARPGFRSPRVAHGIPVLAVDLPSGLDALTGHASDGVLAAERTVTFAALKPGLLLGAGPELAGEVSVADIGLDVSRSRAGLVTDDDVARHWEPRGRDTHKWASAVWVVAGSPGMLGASHLCARAAQRAGAGYVRLSSPGVDSDVGAPTEAVGLALPGDGWDAVVLERLDRIAALALGPGLGRSEDTVRAVRAVLGGADVPIVLDGDGLAALGGDSAALLSARPGPTVITPHDGELRALVGATGDDRTATARDLARVCGATVLLKGPTTVVSDPSGLVRYVTAGDARLATAGTGDVLTGIVAALLGRGLCPLDAASLGAHLHGRAGAIGSARGLVAGDLPDLLPLVFDQI